MFFCPNGQKNGANDRLLVEFLPMPSFLSWRHWLDRRRSESKSEQRQVWSGQSAKEKFLADRKRLIGLKSLNSALKDCRCEKSPPNLAYLHREYAKLSIRLSENSDVRLKAFIFQKIPIESLKNPYIHVIFQCFHNIFNVKVAN